MGEITVPRDLLLAISDPGALIKRDRDKGDYESLSHWQARAVEAAGWVPAAETLQQLRALLNEWEHGEYSATEVEPGIAYCARELRRVLMGGD